MYVISVIHGLYYALDFVMLLTLQLSDFTDMIGDYLDLCSELNKMATRNAVENV